VLLERERAARTEAEVATTRIEALQRITDVALSRTPLDEMLPEMLQRIAPVFGADAIVALVPWTPSGNYLVRAGVGIVQATRTPIRLRGGDAERAIQSRRAVEVGDRSTAELEAIVSERIKASAVAPLGLGESVGLLYVARRAAEPFAPDELALLRLVADRVAGAIERASLFDAERRARAQAEAAEGRMRLLLHAGDALVTPRIDDALGAIARVAVPDLADFCAIDLVDDGGELRRVALAAVDVEMERDNWALASRERRDPSSRHPIWDVLNTGEPIVWEDLDPERLNRLAWSPQHLRMMLERGVHSWMAVPLRKNGRVTGALVFVNAQSKRSFDNDDLLTALELASRVAAAIARA